MALKILVLKDRRPGHFRQSEGVVKAIARRRPVAVAEIADVGAPFLPAKLQRLLVRANPPERLLLRLWGIRVETVEPPDLIVSAGSDTLAPNALLARRFGCRNLFIGSPRGLPPELFTVALRAVPPERLLARQIQVLKPSSVDPDELRPPRPLRPAADFSQLTAALLVGGPTPRYRFAQADWDGLQALVAATSSSGLNWEITSSRRTPDAVADRLAAVAAALERVRFLDFRTAQAGSIAPLFNADLILVTEDSNQMVAEAVAARRPAIVLRSGSPAPPEPSLEALLAERRVAVVPMADLGTPALLDAAASVRALERNPLDVLYDQLTAAGAIPGAVQD